MSYPTQFSNVPFAEKNNYHIFRATIYVGRLKMRGYGVGAKTAGYYIPSVFIRKYIAIIFKLRKIILSIVGLLIIVRMLTYL